MTGWNRVQWQTCPPSSSITSSLRGNIQKVSVSLAGTCYGVQRQTSWVQRFHPAAWIILQPLASTTAVSHSQRLGSEKLPNGSKKTTQSNSDQMIFLIRRRHSESGIWNLESVGYVPLLTENDVHERQNNNNRTFGDNQNWHQLFIIFH